MTSSTDNPKYYKDHVEVVTQACIALGHSKEECKLIAEQSAELFSKKNGSKRYTIPLLEKSKIQKRKAQVRKDIKKMTDKQVMKKHGISRHTLKRDLA